MLAGCDDNLYISEYIPLTEKLIYFDEAAQSYETLSWTSWTVSQIRNFVTAFMQLSNYFRSDLNLIMGKQNMIVVLEIFSEFE